MSCLVITIQQQNAMPTKQDALNISIVFKPPSSNAVTPCKPEEWFSLGVAFTEAQRYNDAELCFRQTLTHTPASLETFLNLGYVLDMLGRSEEALQCYESVLAISPQNAKTRYNRAAHLLRAGDLVNGFADYEFRFAAIKGADNRNYSQPRWDGSPLKGRSILVYCEQGLGDALMFARYLPLLSRLGARVILEVQEPLIRLLSLVEGVENVVAKSSTPPVTDVHIPLLSLPFMFQTTLDSIPNQVPYISPPDDLVATWRARVSQSSRTLNVGLVWTGKAHPYPNRSCSPEHLAPLLSLPGVCFYSLQVGDQERNPLSREYVDAVVDLTREVRDFADSAALIANLDLVVTIDTAVAHLAGALGKPVWVMLPAAADWRWLLDRNDSPWYPSMRLFRQPQAGDWATVVNEVVKVLLREFPQTNQAETNDNMFEARFRGALLSLEQNTPETAIRELRDLGRQLPDEPAIWFNLGRAYEMTGETAEAESTLQRAHELKPESVDILLHLGAALVKQDKLAEAFTCCHKMLELQPDNALARYNLAFLQLRAGDYLAGFANFEARLAVEAFAVDTRHYLQPRWDGTPLDGKSILVFGEQGMGDVIQCARYFPLLAERGAQIVLEIDPPLIPMFENFPGLAKIVPKSATPPLTDLYIQSLSLPHLFGTTLETVPSQLPYLVPGPAKSEVWLKNLEGDTNFRIGLVWRGNPNNPRDKERSCDLSNFAPLADLPGITWYSLQVGAASTEVATAPDSLPLVDFSGLLTDFTETAALIANLDLVISVDTAVAHLTGAMARQVWTILPEEADWRWLRGRRDSPWYATMRVFEQDRDSGWAGVMQRVRSALKKVLTERMTDTADIDIEDYYMEGMRFKEAGDLLAAECSFRRIIEHAPDLPDPQYSLGVVLQLQGRITEAITRYRIATSLDPRFVRAYYNLANACLQQGGYQEAIAAARTTINIEPSHADAHWLYGMLLLQQGDFAPGWQEYEWRWQANGFTSKIPELGRPLWDGAPQAGRILLIHMEQGRGDMIQFIRYAPLVAALGVRVAVCALPELVSLLSTVEGVDLVVDRNGPLPEFDLHIPVQSLPHRFGTILETIPAAVPYLHPTSESRAKWAGRSTEKAVDLRVGLAWEGNRLPNADRTCPLELLAPLLELPGATFFSLQVGGQEPSALVGRLINFTPDICDFSDTAALIETLDLVISIDTAVAHLAGALGKPVWTLLPFVSDWRWLLDREDTPWYPSMRLFRQSSPGDWAGVVSAVQQALVQLLEGHGFTCRSGIDLLRSGDAAAAELAFAAAVGQRPDDAEAHCNHGVALDALGRHEEAIACYQAALSNKPDYMQAVYNLGNTYIALSRLEHAQRCYEHVLELTPGFVPAHLALGEIGKNRHDFSLAYTHYQAASLIDPVSADAFQGLAETYQAEECYAEAIAAYRRVLDLEPGRVNALNMLGSVYQCLEQPEDAEICYRQALTLEPERATVLNNLGVALIAQERIDEAMFVLRHLIEIQPDYAEGHWNLSVALLAAGHYKDGWQEFEWRFKKANPVPQRMFEQPRWDGAPLNGRTILLHAEQGFGDTFQFVRYVPLVAQRGGKVIIECQVPALKRLLSSLDGVAEVVVAGNPLPSFDCHLPLMSLPLIFGTTLDTIPARIPYLTAEPADFDLWQRCLGPARKFRVGLVWFAKQSQVLNRKRSCPLRMFAPLWAVPDVEFYSLQIGVGTEQLEDVNSAVKIIDLTQHINDFADTAAFIKNLDLVITIDTAAAHLAGALGIQTWVVLPHVAEWRWLCRRQDSPWYPNSRLFRQPSRGDWPALMGLVAEALSKCAQDHLKAKTMMSASPRQIVAMPDMARRPCDDIRVGLAWSGRQDNPLNRKRSCPVEALAPLFEVPNVTFVNLQFDAPNGVAARLIDFTDQIQNFEDTAALMANLDLVISIDTSVAHLAAATGRPTWVLLSHVADWRWSTDREDSPWYPGIQLFRQPEHGDWDSVIREVAYRLAEYSGNLLDWHENNIVATRTYCGNSRERQLLEQQLEQNVEMVRLNANHPDAHLDVGASLALLGRHAEAAASFRHVLELNADHVSGHLNLAYSLLALGEYSEGWQHLEWRLHRIPTGLIPPWPMLRHEELGTHPHGTSVLVHCEQGYGDTIQFTRFLPMLAEAGYLVIVSCQPPMATLMTSIGGVKQVVLHGELLPRCDYQMLLLSLPYLFSTTLETLPADIPYLYAREQLKEVWKARIEKKLQQV